ncbi:MAG TPA: hypothetical protein VFZ83_09980 [Acidimicrobiia bacterium]|nr:hypothetical protein [Acidimicrobiia bacterium]
MCTNCIGTADFVATNVVLAAGAVHVALRATEPAELRFARSVVRDAQTVAFLRELALDPVPVLGDAVVRAADDPVVVGAARALVADRRQAGSGLRRGLGAILSQRRLALP